VPKGIFDPQTERETARFNTSLRKTAQTSEIRMHTNFFWRNKNEDPATGLCGRTTLKWVLTLQI
jgi:hypothetical protein